jgi:sodium pump decarboxylase gamma subunit
MDNLMQAFILLLAGFIVVFVVLILLIIVVTVYSQIIVASQNAADKRKAKKAEQQTKDLPKPAVAAPQEEIGDDSEIPGEIIAVIAAAVDSMYGSRPHKIAAVRKARTARSAWSRAGALENTRPF